MKKLILIFALCIPAFAQQVTPNLGLIEPQQWSTNWGAAMNANMVKIDTAVGALQVWYQGAWSASSTYSRGQAVYYNGDVWVSLTNSNTNTPATGTYWELFPSSSTGGGTTNYPLTGAASGGAAPGATFNGSTAVTFDYHTLGAAPALNCTTDQLIYYAATGATPSCLTLGANLSITGGTLNTAGVITVADLTTNSTSGATLYNSGGTLVGIAGKVNAALPMFGVGQPVLSLTTGGSCTSTPTITISAPQTATDGSQATANGYCINGQVESNVTFPGSGYTSATCTITGGGTSSATCSATLMGSANAADPKGVNDSTAAIQNAIDFAYKSATDTQTTAAVYLPQGVYNLSQTILLPCDVWFYGDSSAATVLSLTDANEDGIDVMFEQNHPDAVDCRGGIANLGINATQGHLYTATELMLDGVVGFRMNNLTVSGGGGRGIMSTMPAERNSGTNIEIDTVRWPLILYGNENHLWKLNISAPGNSEDHVTEPDGTSGNYCFSVGNCVNGEFPSWNWAGGTLESAAANGTTATFYVHSSSSQYPNSPIIAGMHFTVAGTTGTSLDGLYVATNVVNGVTSDPSGQCSASNVCFEVQAASTANGTATLTAPTTTATFSSGSYTVTLASATGFGMWGTVSGTGIPSGTRITGVNGDVITISNATTAAGSAETVTGSVSWMPTIMPTSNAAVDFSGANVAISDGSIKALMDANCFQNDGTIGSVVSSFYCEGYPVNGQPVEASTLRDGSYPTYTYTTATLPGNSYAYESIGVQDTSWFAQYINNPSLIYEQGTGGLYPMMIAPADFVYGSTAASADVPGVERGQYELVYGIFTANNQFVVIQRNAGGSTAPAGTTWPAGSILSVFSAKSGSSYGTFTFAHNHANAIDGPDGNWSVGCNDQSSTGNVCGEFILGSPINNIGAFSTGVAGGLGGQNGVNVLFLANDIWKWVNATQGTESVGEGFIKSVGQGGTAEVIDQLNSDDGYGDESATGQLYADGYVNVLSYDGSSPSSQYTNDSTGTFFNEPNAIGVTKIQAWEQDANGPGSPLGGQYGLQFQNSYCYWDTSTADEGHAQARWCMVGGPQTTTPDYEFDTWSGSSWVTQFEVSASGLSGSSVTSLPQLGNTQTWSGANTFTDGMTIDQGGYTLLSTYAGGVAFHQLLQESADGCGNSSTNTWCSGREWDNFLGWNGTSGFANAAEFYWSSPQSSTTVPTEADFTLKPGPNGGTSSITDFGLDISAWNKVMLPASVSVGGSAGYTGTVTPTKTGCVLTITAGLITAESGC